MKIEEVKRLLEIANAIDAELRCDFSGPVFVTISHPASRGECGWVSVDEGLAFVWPDHEDGEGWEFHSQKEGHRLKNPRFMLESGDEITVEEAEAMLADKAVVVS